MALPDWAKRRGLRDPNEKLTESRKDELVKEYDTWARKHGVSEEILAVTTRQHKCVEMQLREIRREENYE